VPKHAILLVVVEVVVVARWNKHLGTNRRGREIGWYWCDFLRITVAKYAVDIDRKPTQSAIDESAPHPDTEESGEPIDTTRPEDATHGDDRLNRLAFAFCYGFGLIEHPALA